MDSTSSATLVEASQRIVDDWLIVESWRPSDGMRAAGIPVAQHRGVARRDRRFRRAWKNLGRRADALRARVSAVVPGRAAPPTIAAAAAALAATDLDREQIAVALRRAISTLPPDPADAAWVRHFCLNVPMHEIEAEIDRVASDAFLRAFVARAKAVAANDTEEEPAVTESLATAQPCVAVPPRIVEIGNDLVSAGAPVDAVAGQLDQWIAEPLRSRVPNRFLLAILAASIGPLAALDRKVRRAMIDAALRGVSNGLASEGGGPLKFFGVEDLLSADRASTVQYVCTGLVALGCTSLVAGPPKAGKSTFAFALVSAVERGVPFAGMPTVQSSAVVITEEGDGTLRQKIERFGIERARFINRRALLLGRPFAEVVEAGAAEAIATGAKLVLIDTLAAWCNLTGEAENDAGVMNEIMRALARAAEHGLGVLAVHHARKNGENSDPSQVFRGSSAIAAGPEILLSLARSDGNAVDASARELTVTSRLDDDLPPVHHLDLVGDTYVSLPSGAEAKEAGERRRVLDALRVARVALTASDTSERANVRKQSTVKALALLVNAGEVIRSGTGKRGDAHRFATPPISGASDSVPDSGNRNSSPAAVRASSVSAVPPMGWEQQNARNGGNCSQAREQLGTETETDPDAFTFDPDADT